MEIGLGRVEIWRGPKEPSENGEESKDPFTADTFLNFLRRSNPKWDPTTGQLHEQHWVYRGHQNEAWPLVPSAARQQNNPLQPLIDIEREKIDSNTTLYGRSNDHLRHIVANISAYRNAMRSFMRLGNEIGLIDEKPEGTIFGGPPGTDVDDNGSARFPYRYLVSQGGPTCGTGLNVSFNESHNISALAQHHGVPTFLLDWTKNPWIAAHFASTDSRNSKDENDICVWALNSNEAMKISPITGVNGLGAIGINEPIKSKNIYLAKQDGILTCVAKDRGIWEATGTYPPMEEIIEKWTESEMREHGTYYHPSDGALILPADREALIESYFRPELPILRKVMLKKEHLPDLRLLLRREGITRAHLMPTLDNIAKTAMEMAEDALKS